MKEQWILAVKTDIDNPKNTKKLLDTKYMIFEDYENAKSELIKTLKSYTFSDNIMFDGNGSSKVLEMYFDDLIKMGKSNYKVNYECDYKFFTDYLQCASKKDFEPDSHFFKVLKVFHENQLKSIKKDDCLVGNNAKKVLEVINKVLRCELIDLQVLDINAYKNNNFEFIKDNNEIMLKNTSFVPKYFYLFLKTNMINLREEKDYYFYLTHDYIEDTEPSLFIELKKAKNA